MRKRQKQFPTNCRISPKDWDEKLVQESLNPRLSISQTPENNEVERERVETEESMETLNSELLLSVQD